MKINSHLTVFMRRHYPTISRQQWNDWRWQLSASIKTREALEQVLILGESERKFFERSGSGRKLSITPYYLSLLNTMSEDDPLRRMVIPRLEELYCSDSELHDPLAEDHDSPVPGLVHRYPDRVLLLASSVCPVLCRYCTRSRLMLCDSPGNKNASGKIDQAIQYIAERPQIRDVIISGGDPLIIGNDRLEAILSSLRRIPHVEMIRIGTKVPAVLPMRVDAELCRMLKKYHPLYMSLHFSHPDEITPETKMACERLADAGIPLGSQTVLLRGVNDDEETMKALFHKLLMIRVKPYYLYQCDPVPGSEHFRTPVMRGLEIIDSLRGHTSGYAVPQYVIDAPRGGGKIPLLPEYVQGHDGEQLLLRNYENSLYSYPDSFGIRSSLQGSRELIS
ncbi:MAG: KamA family radical SAM protein [Spirochaetaceae bacterium]|nr:MAG: KamA family radical SAM protein [Spirochaetaceae bacterium]